MKALAAIITIAGCFLGHYSGHASVAPGTQFPSDLEKRAVSETQRILAQELDPELPMLPFANWLKQVFGAGAGIVWQLGECGEATSASSNPAGDIRACVEANSILSDGRRVIVMISIGTFKKGMTGPPAFRYGVIQQNDQLRPIRRLRDLQNLLSAPWELAKRPSVALPELNMPSIRYTTNNVYLPIAASGNGEEIGLLTEIEEPPPEPPSNRPRSSPPSLNQTRSIQQVVDEVLEGTAITRVGPIYPPTARALKAFGTVRVQVTISETGRVIDAKAISGHQALRPAAVNAAYKWVFKPTTVDGAAIKAQGVLTFDFKSRPQ
jgi:TonB family protein